MSLLPSTKVDANKYPSASTLGSTLITYYQRRLIGVDADNRLIASTLWSMLLTLHQKNYFFKKEKIKSISIDQKSRLVIGHQRQLLGVNADDLLFA
jgi:hypothetical protein